MAGNHYYQENQTYSVCGKTLAQVQAGGMEIGSTVQAVPSAADIVTLVMRQLGAPGPGMK